eukprot:bmy_13325T0
MAAAALRNLRQVVGMEQSMKRHLLNRAFLYIEGHRRYFIVLSTVEGNLFPRSCSGTVCPDVLNSVG